jgi:hypothetical protein
MGGLVKMPFPVPRNAPRGARHRLIDGVMLWRREHRTLDDRLDAVVPEPALPRLEALDHRVTGIACVPRGVLTRRCVAASDVATEGTAAEVEPPPPGFQALYAARATRGHIRINLGHVCLQSSETYLGFGNAVT